MRLPFAKYLDRLDAIYRDQPFFAGVKARLMAIICVVLLIFVPINVVKLVWTHSPFLMQRMGINVVLVVAALLSLRLLFLGRLTVAGNALGIALLVPINLAVFVPREYLQPVGLAVGALVYNTSCLMTAIIFASRRVAFILLAVVVAGNFGVSWLVLGQTPLAGSLEFAGSAILHEGTQGIVFIFILGVAVLQMVETAHHRSEESLRETRALNQNLERLVAERTKELERLNDEKNAFLGMAAHDLRNPAVKIRMIAETIEHEGDYSEPRIRTSLATVRDTATRLLGLLNNLLDVAAIEEGRMTLHPVRLDARAVLRDVHGDFRAAAAAKDITLMLEPPPPGAPDTLPVLLDAAAIRQVLDNLVSNALKFSQPGSTSGSQSRPTPGTACASPSRMKARD